MGVEQRLDRREVVDVVGEREPGRGVVRLGARRRLRDGGFDGGEVDRVGAEVDDGCGLLEQHLDRRQPERVGHGQPRGRVVRFARAGDGPIALATCAGSASA